MYQFLAGVGEWFAEHDLMSAQAGHWVAWTVFVVIPVVTVVWWAWMVSNAMNDYHSAPTKENKFLMFVAWTAPISVPVMFLMAGLVWVGRKFNMA